MFDRHRQQRLHGVVAQGVHAAAAHRRASTLYEQRSRQVIVQNQADGGGILDAGLDRIAQVDEERLIRLVQPVTVDRDGDRWAVTPGAKVSVPLLAT